MLRHTELLQEDEKKGTRSSAVRSSLLLKRATQHVSSSTQNEQQRTIPAHISDDGSKDWAMITCFLRAVRKQHWWRARSLAMQLDCLKPFRT